MSNRPFPPITLEDLISHDELLTRYPWLTAQIINRWRRKGAIRYFRGAKGITVYPLSDIVDAITRDMNEDAEK